MKVQSDYETVMYKPEYTELLRSFDSDRVLGMFLDFFLLFQMGMMYTYDGDGQSEE